MKNLKLDLSIRKNGCYLMPEHKSGVYIFYGRSHEILYVGQSSDLKSEIRHNFNKNKSFDYCKMRYEGDLTKRKEHEDFLVNEYQPKFNKVLN